jgi:endoglucanase
VRRGVNLGNAFDALPGAPRFALADRHLDLVREAGLDTVRLPVRWSAHAAAEPPYRIDPRFGERVDRVVDAALARDLTVVLDVHHYAEVLDDPDAHAPRLVALWRQLAARYADRPPGLLLELLNEPHRSLTAARWNRLLAEVLAAVREVSPARDVVAGPVAMNDVAALPELDLPPDPHLLATVHYYAPFEFTHQGAPWVPDAAAWLGTEWHEDDGLAAVRADLSAAAEWARARGHRLFVGEFGAYEAAGRASRVRWTRAVRAEAERLDLPWCYWNFATDFGVYDEDRDAWRPDLLAALLG